MPFVYTKLSRSYARCSTADRPDGGGSPAPRTRSTQAPLPRRVGPCRACWRNAEHLRCGLRTRTRLAFGGFLRRSGHRVNARTHLRAALATFDEAGAAPWAERARQELRASGETARKRDPSTTTNLTAQELQVVRLVRQGLSNRDAAAQLFLSPPPSTSIYATSSPSSVCPHGQNSSPSRSASTGQSRPSPNPPGSSA